jgi:hypothetical protein
MTGPAPPGASPSLEAAAHRIGHYCWIEMRAFETLGAWSASVPEPELRAMLATHSRQHAWHAELWHDLLPVIGEAGVERFVEPPSSVSVTFVEALAAPGAPERTIEKLAGAYRVLVPHAVAAYQRHLSGSSQISDGATIRALRLVLSDQVEHWREGEATLQSLLRSEGDVDRAASHQARLEKLLVAAGGVAGS